MDEDIGKFFEEEKERRKKQFGLESMLRQILWNAQIIDDDFNEAFTEVVTLMRHCIEDDYYKKQLYEINLNDYKNEDSD